MTGPDGGGLTMEFYKSATALARDAFRLRGMMDHWLVFCMGGERGLTARVGAVAGEVRDHALVTSLLRGCGAGCRGGTLAPVVWRTCGFL